MHYLQTNTQNTTEPTKCSFVTLYLDGLERIYHPFWQTTNHCKSLLPSVLAVLRHFVIEKNPCRQFPTQRYSKPIDFFWVFPKIVVPPNLHPKMIIFSRKTNGCWGNPPFMETPFWGENVQRGGTSTSGWSVSTAPWSKALEVLRRRTFPKRKGFPGANECGFPCH